MRFPWTSDDDIPCKWRIRRNFRSKPMGGACVSSAWPGFQVEEADCEVEDQKVLTFRGKGPGPPGTKVGLARCLPHHLPDLAWCRKPHFRQKVFRQ